MSDIHKGLAGVVADTTAISTINIEKSTLTYRGYAVPELARSYRFEDIAYLLWHDDLPNSGERRSFVVEERAMRAIPDDLIDILRKFPPDTHPMDVLRTAISFLGACDKNDGDDLLKKSISLWAKIPTIIAADHRIRNGKPPIPPRDDISMSENFFHMYFGEIPDEAVVNAFDASLIFYAEHSFNASTFTARTIVSSLSDIYSGVTGAIGSLKGPLHGGANEAVMEVFKEIGTPDNAEKWIRDALAEKRLVMGFGHRVYKNGDSRVPYMTEVFHDTARVLNGQKWVDIADILNDRMVNEKGIHPNLDFPVGPTYYMMGFDIPTFTPIFVMSRITGWCAHIMEQLDNNKLIRPLSRYEGHAQRAVPSADKN